VFHRAFPNLQIDLGTPIIVLAINDEKGFRALEPEAYLAKGQVRLAGLFLRALDKNYVLMRLDAEGEHPYSVVYHEYTHLLLGKSAEWLPLWLDEGLAEFYQNTDIHEKEISLGQASRENIMLLRQNRLLPLVTLFTVDEKSPYYHEEHKGSIFYAESWALTHYILATDRHDKGSRMKNYAEQLAQGVDPVSAASTAFGDLKQLQAALEHYVQQSSFSYVKISATTDVDDSTFTVRPLTPAQTDALRADFLAYNQRFAEAQSLLERALQEDPNNASAHETMGYLEYRQGHQEEAGKWYTQAVQLDSQNYLAHYYSAAIAMDGGAAPADESRIESSLRAAIKLNPSFAPTYDRLAVFLATRRRDLKEAQRMGVTAVTLDPESIGYRINVANILLDMKQGQNAIAVLQAAAKLAKTPQDSEAVENMLVHAQLYSAEMALENKPTAEINAERSTEEASPGERAAKSDIPKLAHRASFVPSGPHRFLTGTLSQIHCDSPELDLTLNFDGKGLALHSENYYKIQFSALNFKPSAVLNPCKDLEGRPAKVEYVESADKAVTARVLSIELHQ